MFRGRYKKCQEAEKKKKEKEVALFETKLHYLRLSCIVWEKVTSFLTIWNKIVPYKIGTVLD